MLDPKTEWPDEIEEIDSKRIVLQQTVVFTRSHFDGHPIKRIAMMLLKEGTLPIKSTDEVRKYILEVEIVD